MRDTKVKQKKAHEILGKFLNKKKCQVYLKKYKILVVYQTSSGLGLLFAARPRLSRTRPDQKDIDLTWDGPGRERALWRAVYNRNLIFIAKHLMFW